MWVGSSKGHWEPGLRERDLLLPVCLLVLSGLLNHSSLCRWQLVPAAPAFIFWLSQNEPPSSPWRATVQAGEHLPLRGTVWTLTALTFEFVTTPTSALGLSPRDGGCFAQLLSRYHRAPPRLLLKFCNITLAICYIKISLEISVWLLFSCGIPVWSKEGFEKHSEIWDNYRSYYINYLGRYES